MTHVVKAWLIVLIALLVAGSQLVLSQNGTRQTKVIGNDRLVSVQPLPQMAGEMCVYPEEANPELIASLQQYEGASALMASLPRQQTGAAGTAAASAPPRP